MSLLDRIRGLFTRSPLPDETQSLIAGVKDVEELRAGLDEIATRNEVEAREIEREIEKLGKMEAALKQKVAEGTLSEREKMSTLREIRRLRRRMDSLEKRHRIHQDNIDLHLGLFDRITEMQAMELKKVNQQQIEEIAVDYEEKMEKHRDILNAARAAQSMDSAYEDSAERAALADLEREILAEAGAGEETREGEGGEAEEKEDEEEEGAGEGKAPEEEKRDVEAAPRAAEPAAEAGAPSSAGAAPARRALDQEMAALEEGKGSKDIDGPEPETE